MGHFFHPIGSGPGSSTSSAAADDIFLVKLAP
jgi:hypothetical protein